MKRFRIDFPVTDFPEIEHPSFPEILTPRDPEPPAREEPRQPDSPRRKS